MLKLFKRDISAIYDHGLAYSSYLLKWLVLLPHYLLSSLTANSSPDIVIANRQQAQALVMSTV